MALVLAAMIVVSNLFNLLALRWLLEIPDGAAVAIR